MSSPAGARPSGGQPTHDTCTATPTTAIYPQNIHEKQTSTTTLATTA